MRPAILILAVLSALAWCGVIAQQALVTWPRLPLDSGNDAATLAALKRAETWHLVRHVALALVPAAVSVWLAARRR